MSASEYKAEALSFVPGGKKNVSMGSPRHEPYGQWWAFEADNGHKFIVDHNQVKGFGSDP